MNTRLTQTMSLAALGWLGQAFENTSIISPFRSVTPEQFEETAHRQLMDGGVIDEAGQITPQWLVPLQKLADTDSFGRVRLLAGDRRAERFTFFTGRDRESVAVTVAPGNVRIDYLPEVEDFLAEMREFLGDSVLSNAAVSVDLPFIQALLVAALLDRNRQAVLRAFADEGTIQFPASTPEELRTLVEEVHQPPQRITGVIKSLPGREEMLPIQEIEQHLEAMESAGILRRTENGYHLSDALQVLASSCLVFEHMVHLDAGRLNADGELEMHEALCLQAGVHDLLRIDPGGDTVTMESMSSNHLLRFIKEILSEAPVQ